MPCRILLGVIGRPHGVRGLVHVTSYADPPEAIASYGALSDNRGRRFALRWRGEGLAAIAEIVDGAERRIVDRAAAARLTNLRLFVAREQLPSAGEDEFYLADLVGLRAFDAAGAELGEVTAVHDYGAGVSLEIGGGLVVPFTRAAVPVVDVSGKRLVVDPPAVVEAPSPGALSRADLSRGAGEATGDEPTSPASGKPTSPARGRGRLAKGEAGEGACR